MTVRLWLLLSNIVPSSVRDAGIRSVVVVFRSTWVVMSKGRPGVNLYSMSVMVKLTALAKKTCCPFIRLFSVLLIRISDFKANRQLLSIYRTFEKFLLRLLMTSGVVMAMTASLRKVTLEVLTSVVRIPCFVDDDTVKDMFSSAGSYRCSDSYDHRYY